MWCECSCVVGKQTQREKWKQFFFVLWIMQEIHPVCRELGKTWHLSVYTLPPLVTSKLFQTTRNVSIPHNVQPFGHAQLLGQVRKEDIICILNESFGTSSWETVDNSSTMQSYVEGDSSYWDCSIHFRRSRLCIEIYSWPKSATFFFIFLPCFDLIFGCGLLKRAREFFLIGNGLYSWLLHDLC